MPKILYIRIKIITYMDLKSLFEQAAADGKSLSERRELTAIVLTVQTVY